MVFTLQVRLFSWCADNLVTSAVSLIFKWGPLTKSLTNFWLCLSVEKEAMNILNLLSYIFDNYI